LSYGCLTLRFTVLNVFSFIDRSSAVQRLIWITATRILKVNKAVTAFPKVLLLPGSELLPSIICV